MNPTSFLYWWPAVRDLGIPVPQTEVVEIEPASAEQLMEGCIVHNVEHDIDEFQPDCAPLYYRYADALLSAGHIGYPLFAKTDLVSGKHEYLATCYVPSEGELLPHVYRLLEEHAMAMFLELEGEVRAIVLREMLDLDAPFRAFNGLPIARERRYFVSSGEVECTHPYWPEGVLQFWGPTHPEPKNWNVQLSTLNREGAAEIALLTEYAERVGAALPGAWSVDFARARDGTWYLIDMAEAEHSWHPAHRQAVV